MIPGPAARHKRARKEGDVEAVQMVGELNDWTSGTVLDEDTMIAERVERSVWKLSVTIGVIAKTFATGA